MGIDANRYGDVVDFVIGKQAVALYFPGIEHFAAQGQDGLVLFVAAHFGAAASGVTFYQEDFVISGVFAFAVS